MQFTLADLMRLVSLLPLALIGWIEPIEIAGLVWTAALVLIWYSTRKDELLQLRVVILAGAGALIAAFVMAATWSRNAHLTMQDVNEGSSVILGLGAPLGLLCGYYGVAANAQRGAVHSRTSRRRLM